MHEFFEHTADLGLRVRAADLETLFVEAATALFEAIVDNLDAVQAKRSVAVRIDGTELEYLLFDWLKELLYRFDSEHLLLSRFAVKKTPAGLEGTAWGEELDRQRHELGHEV